MKTEEQIKLAITSVNDNKYLNRNYKDDVIDILAWVLGGDAFDGLEGKSWNELNNNKDKQYMYGEHTDDDIEDRRDMDASDIKELQDMGVEVDILGEPKQTEERSCESCIYPIIHGLVVCSECKDVSNWQPWKQKNQKEASK